jgi:hypothetical protein
MEITVASLVRLRHCPRYRHFAPSTSSGWLVGWLGGWVVGWLGGWVVGWLGDRDQYTTRQTYNDFLSGNRLVVLLLHLVSGQGTA